MVMRLFSYGSINRNLSDHEIRQLVTYLVQPGQTNDSDPHRDLIEPALEADIELMVVPVQRVAKMARQQYVDDFFSRGILQLGTCEYFRTAGNPEVRDHMEGNISLVGQGLQRTAWGKFQASDDSYLFCTYLGEPDPAVLRAFGYDSCYFIDDPSGFALAINRSLEAFSSSFGKCVYCEEKALIGGLSPEHSFERIDHRTAQMVGEAMHFVKPVRYSHQNEFRFTWKTSHATHGTLIIECPEAVQYCSRR